MAKNDLVLLDYVIDERISKKIPSSKNDEVFELLAYEQILKEYDLPVEDLLMGSVDGKDDGGIDAIYCFVNGRLISEEKGAVLPKKNANLELYLITCKHKDSFKQEPLNNIFTSMQELMDFSKGNAEFDGKYNDSVLEKRGIFVSVYKKVAAILGNFSIRVIYACRGDAGKELSENIKARGRQIESLCGNYFSGCCASVEFWGATEILEAYRRKPDYSLSLPFEKLLIHEEQMVVLVKLKDYFKFLTYDDGKIRKYLFDSNVRDFMGISSVNEDIMASLTAIGNDEDFWWLNNGITILCSSAVPIGKSICLSNIQIVNGLQTSECIYRYFSSSSVECDERSVLVKILSCWEKKVADDIIRSTNNQTSIFSASLRATDKVQEDIEDILKQNGMYYERRVNYYLNQGVEREKIYSPLYLASGYMALVLKRPYKACGLKQRFMRKEDSYRKVFSDENDIKVWPIIAICMRKTDNYLETVRYNNGERFLKTYRYVVAFITISKLIGKFSYTIRELILFDTERLTREEFEQTWEQIREIESSRNKRINWRSRDTVLGILEEIGAKTAIGGFAAIDKRAKQVNITDEYLKDVLKILPSKKCSNDTIIKIISKEMSLSEHKASVVFKELKRRRLLTDNNVLDNEKQS